MHLVLCHEPVQESCHQRSRHARAGPKHSVTSADSKYLFIPGKKSHQDFFSETVWSKLLVKLFKDKTGVDGMFSTMLKTSFVTHFYGFKVSSDQGLRESIASAMRHSIKVVFKKKAVTKQ